MNFMRGFKKFWKKKNIILEDGQPGFERELIKNKISEVIKTLESYNNI